MMFKRKQAREVSVGELCIIDENIKNKMMISDIYLNNSPCYQSRAYGLNNVSSNIFNENNKKFLFEDVSLFYVKKKSIFGVLEIVPLFFDTDQNGFLSRKAINSDTTMLCSSKSLEFCSQDKLNKVLQEPYPSTLNFVRRMLSAKFNFNNPWVVD